MRWKSKNYQDEVGYWKFNHNRFLLFPKRINGEWRWFEWAKWESKWVNNKWEDLNWIN